MFSLLKRKMLAEPAPAGSYVCMCVFETEALFQNIQDIETVEAELEQQFIFDAKGVLLWEMKRYKNFFLHRESEFNIPLKHIIPLRLFIFSSYLKSFHELLLFGDISKRNRICFTF